MIDEKEKKVVVINKFGGTVGYDIPDLNIHRDFFPKERKEISFQELLRLSYVPGGETILRQYLEITDAEVASKILHFEPQPEYYYSVEDVIKLMKEGTLEQFLDCLDFAPQVIKDAIKDAAVNLPLNDVDKREAIKEKLGLDVSKAIQIKNTKTEFEEENREPKEVKQKTQIGRRTAKPNIQKPIPTGKRYSPDKE